MELPWVGRFILGHGTRTSGAGVFIFDQENEMKSQGFQPYCPDLLNRPPLEDSSLLSKHTRIAGIAIAIQCAMTAASNFMKQSYASEFNRSLGASTKETLLKLNNGITAQDVLSYLRLPVPEEIGKVINTDKPGSGDQFSFFLAEAAKQVGGGVAFQRGGVLGFDMLVVPLATETVKSIAEACHQFRW